MDRLAAALGLILLSPVLLTVAAAVRTIDGSPTIFRQHRVNWAGRSFTLLKFRTMRAVAGTAVTAAGDPRITPLGRLLRRTKLDELPQLVNVLRGEMRFVGPRPEVPGYARPYPPLAGEAPGVTDWASLAFHDEEAVLARAGGDIDAFYRTRLLPRKLALARLYRRVRTPCLDVRVILATALFAVRLRSLSRSVAGASLMERARRGF